MRGAAVGVTCVGPDARAAASGWRARARNTNCDVAHAPQRNWHTLIACNLTLSSGTRVPSVSTRFRARRSISLTDREAIKGHMVGLMCEAPADVQRQLSAALSIISNSDFPAKWQNLLPELISKFATSDLQVIHGVLLTANSIMKRFRYVFKTDALFSELKYVLELLQEPLLGLFKAMGDMLATPGATAQQLGVVMEALRLICRIFFSLNWQVSKAAWRARPLSSLARQLPSRDATAHTGLLF